MHEIPIAQPSLGEEEWQALRGPLFTGWVTQGPQVAAFEQAFVKRHDAAHAVAASSCTAGLHLILSALGVGPGDEVVVPSLTWVATANVVVHCGATPVFADVLEATYNVDPVSVAARVNPRTKAVIAVHLFGLCADMDAIRAAAGNVALVEDAACATGARYKGRSAGTLGVAGAFSFHPRKIITTGEGGMVITQDAALADRVRALRSHGGSLSEEQRHRGARPYELPDFPAAGFNYRMTDLQGAIGRVQLEKLDALIAQRRRLADVYARELAGIDWLQAPRVPEGYEPTWQSYVCLLARDAPVGRDEVMVHLLDKGIHTRPGTHAVHLQTYFRERYDLAEDAYPVAAACDRRTLALPMHNHMDEADCARVAGALKELG